MRGESFWSATTNFCGPHWIVSAVTKCTRLATASPTFDTPRRAMSAPGAAEGIRSLGLEIRAGVHTGELELSDGDVQGIAVHIGAQYSALAGAGEVFVSSTVKDLVTGSGLSFRDAGEHELKGVPSVWRLYRVID